MTTGDFILIGAVILFAFIGFVKGGAKMFFGLFLFLVIVIASSFFAAWVTPRFLTTETEGGIEYTGAATALMDPIQKALPFDDPVLDVPITKGDDGIYYVDDLTVEEACSSASKMGGMDMLVYTVIRSSISPGQTIKTLLAYKLTSFIYEAVIWLVLVIVLLILRNIVRKKIYRFLDDHSAPSIIDRSIGLVINLAILVVLSWGVVALFLKFPTFDFVNNLDFTKNFSFLTDATATLTNGLVARPFHELNPLLKLLNLTLPA